MIIKYLFCSLILIDKSLISDLIIDVTVALNILIDVAEAWTFFFASMFRQKLIRSFAVAPRLSDESIFFLLFSNNTKLANISFFIGFVFFIESFWRHVAPPSSLCQTTGCMNRMTEVAHIRVVVIVKKDVLNIQVAVDHACWLQWLTHQDHFNSHYKSPWFRQLLDETQKEQTMQLEKKLFEYFIIVRDLFIDFIVTPRWISLFIIENHFQTASMRVVPFVSLPILLMLLQKQNFELHQVIQP